MIPKGITGLTVPGFVRDGIVRYCFNNAVATMTFMARWVPMNVVDTFVLLWLITSMCPLSICGFNRWMQHTRNCASRRSVANETKTTDLLHGKPESPDGKFAYGARARLDEAQAARRTVRKHRWVCDLRGAADCTGLSERHVAQFLVDVRACSVELQTATGERGRKTDSARSLAASEMRLGQSPLGWHQHHHPLTEWACLACP
jgi:hypothetical protein